MWVATLIANPHCTIGHAWSAMISKQKHLDKVAHSRYGNSSLLGEPKHDPVTASDSDPELCPRGAYCGDHGVARGSASSFEDARVRIGAKGVWS